MAVIAFYIFSLLLLLSAATVILARNPVHAVLFLILGFFNAAGLFILLGAEFVAMILVIVYVGAVAVLFLFVVMMLNIKPQLHSLWFTKNQRPELKQVCRNMAVYLPFWIIVTTMCWYGTSWLAQTCMNQNLLLINENAYVIPAVIAPASHISIPNHTAKIVSIGLLIVSTFIASHITARCTHIRFFDTASRLFKSLPVPIFISGLLALELIITLGCWASKDGFPVQTIQVSKNITNTHALAPLIYLDYMLVFLISGLILLVAMIGAIVLTLTERSDNKRQNISRQLARCKSDTLEICKVNVGEGIQ